VRRATSRFERTTDYDRDAIYKALMDEADRRAAHSGRTREIEFADIIDRDPDAADLVAQYRGMSPTITKAAESRANRDAIAHGIEAMARVAYPNDDSATAVHKFVGTAEGPSLYNQYRQLR